MIAKYQFMEGNVAKRAAGLREKLPEMEGTLGTVRFLRKQKDQSLSKTDGEDGGGDDDIESDAGSKGDLSTTFSLSETLYARAVITPSTIDEVYLWLGANVMPALQQGEGPPPVGRDGALYEAGPGGEVRGSSPHHVMRSFYTPASMHPFATGAVLAGAGVAAAALLTRMARR